MRSSPGHPGLRLGPPGSPNLSAGPPAARPATFRVRNKIFLIGSQEGEAVSIKASLEDQSGLIEMDPETFSVAAYTGRFGWVRVQLAALSPQLAKRLIENAWRRTAPKRVLGRN
ncbi:MAG TPA: MmcQ/YjbR family DNA-binding protein [Candidatus Dormibacteraeota bacterium]